MFNTWNLVFIGIVFFLVTDCHAGIRRRLETLEMEVRYINTSSNEIQMVIYNMCDRFDELNETLSRDSHKCESSIQNESFSLQSLAHLVDQISRRLEVMTHKVEDNNRMYHSHDTFERRQLKRLQKELHESKEEIKKLNTENDKMVALLEDLVEANAANFKDT
ncbi:hypothetical protein DPMN_094572 [Dreissena polymorpha]|uniref:Secreted protein n=1 Tax=Dreissena polymorpha TaxID=45954 RepID=A0A9D4R1X9_DREPO|nr:hypothetical protein DPMN_094572 [Dreissena polymorpha]